MARCMLYECEYIPGNEDVEEGALLCIRAYDPQGCEDIKLTGSLHKPDAAVSTV